MTHKAKAVTTRNIATSSDVIFWSWSKMSKPPAGFTLGTPIMSAYSVPISMRKRWCPDTGKWLATEGIPDRWSPISFNAWSSNAISWWMVRRLRPHIENPLRTRLASLAIAFRRFASKLTCRAPLLIGFTPAFNPPLHRSLSVPRSASTAAALSRAVDGEPMCPYYFAATKILFQVFRDDPQFVSKAGQQLPTPTPP